jgi:hypothetical protein
MKLNVITFRNGDTIPEAKTNWNGSQLVNQENLHGVTIITITNGRNTANYTTGISERGED